MKVKAILIGLFLAFIGINANSQDGGFIPSSGIAVELNSAPFSNTPVNLNSLKARYFLGGGMVARLGLDLDLNNAKTTTEIGNNTTETLSRSLDFGLSPGIEMHMNATDRISPYVGAVIPFGITNVKSATTTTIGNTTTESETKKAPGSQTMFGLNVVTGADVYIIKKLYLGVELGYGLSFISTPESETIAGGTTTKSGTKSSSVVLGDNFNAFFRLGYVLF